MENGLTSTPFPEELSGCEVCIPLQSSFRFAHEPTRSEKKQPLPRPTGRIEGVDSTDTVFRGGRVPNYRLPRRRKDVVR